MVIDTGKKTLNFECILFAIASVCKDREAYVFYG